MKTSDLIGPALDWAVAKCEGIRTPEFLALLYDNEDNGFWTYRYSTDWSQGGPIIDGIPGFVFKQWLESSPNTRCEAHIHNYEGNWIAFGPTPLIAAMRCFCCSKLGDVVDIPEELCQQQSS